MSKRIPQLGWTPNLGHPAGALWLVGLIVAPMLMIILVWVLVEMTR